MADYGYRIEHILMVDIIPDAAVRKAMNEINAGIVLFLFMQNCFQVIQLGKCQLNFVHEVKT